MKIRKLLSICLSMMLVMCISGCSSTPADTSRIKSSEIEDVFQNPDSYVDRKITVLGQVIDECEDSGDHYTFKIYQDVENKSNVVVVEGDSAPSKGEYVKVDGVVSGTQSVYNNFGVAHDVLKIKDAHVIKSAPQEAANPTQNSVSVNQEVKHGSVTITLDKIEYSREETRVYLTVLNNSPYDFNLWTFKCVAAQGSKKFTSQDNPAYSDLVDLKEAIPTTHSAKGFIVFGPMEKDTETKFLIKGDLDTNKESVEDFVFTTEAAGQI